MATDYAVCVSVRVRKGDSTHYTIVNKKICKFSPKLSMGDIVDEVVGDKEIDKDVNFALDHGLFAVKLTATEGGDSFTTDNEETLKTAIDFHPNLRYLVLISHCQRTITITVCQNRN